MDYENEMTSHGGGGDGWWIAALAVLAGAFVALNVWKIILVLSA